MTDSKTFGGLFLIGFLALVPVMAVDMPRFMAFGPGGLAFVTLLAAFFIAKSKPDLFPKNQALMLVGVLLLGAVSSLWSAAPDDSMDRVTKLLPVFFLGSALLTCALNVEKQQIQRFVWLLPAGLILASILTVIEIRSGAPFYHLIRGNDMDSAVSMHVFNRGAVTIALLSFPAMFMARSLPHARYWIAGLFASVFLMLSQVESQSAQLAAIMGVLAFVIFPFASKKAWHALVGLVAVLIVFSPVLAIWMFNHWAAPLNDIALLGKGGGNIGARMEIWDYVSRYVANSPLYGHGIEASRSITDFDSAEIYQEGTSILHPHNFSLQLWLEFGVIGAIAGVAFCSYLLMSISKLPSVTHRKIFLLGFIPSLCVAATGYGMWQGWWLGLLFMVAAFCIFAVKINDDKA